MEGNRTNENDDDMENMLVDAVDVADIRRMRRW